MLPQRYELDVLVARTISHSFTALTSDCSCHSNIKFISSRHRVMSSIYWVRPTWSTQPFRLYQEDKLTKSSGFLSVHSLLEAANFSEVIWSWELSNCYHSMHFSFLFIGWEPFTWPANNRKPTNNGLVMCNTIQLSFAADKILLMRNCNHTSVWKMVDNCFPELSESACL